MRVFATLDALALIYMEWRVYVSDYLFEEMDPKKPPEKTQKNQVRSQKPKMCGSGFYHWINREWQNFFRKCDYLLV